MLLEREVPPSYWRCPVSECTEVVFLGGCYVSPYFAAVLAALPDSDAVEIRPDGAFTAAEKGRDERLPAAPAAAPAGIVPIRAEPGDSKDDEFDVDAE